MSIRTRFVPLAVLVAALAIASPAGAQSGRAGAAPASELSVAIRDTKAALGNAERQIAHGSYSKALRSLTAVRGGIIRADRAARRRMHAAVAEEAEGTPGPDAALAVLAVERQSVMRLAGLFTGHGGLLVKALRYTMARAQMTRSRLLGTVIGLDPEGSGADYADGMADSLDGYAAEIASLNAALAGEQLSPEGATGLRAALDRSLATQAQVTAAFGGGE